MYSGTLSSSPCACTESVLPAEPSLSPIGPTSSYHHNHNQTSFREIKLYSNTAEHLGRPGDLLARVKERWTEAGFLYQGAYEEPGVVLFSHRDVREETQARK